MLNIIQCFIMDLIHINIKCMYCDFLYSNYLNKILDQYLQSKAGGASLHPFLQFLVRVMFPLLRYHPKVVLEINMLTHVVKPAPYNGQSTEPCRVHLIGNVPLERNDKLPLLMFSCKNTTYCTDTAHPKQNKLSSLTKSYEIH